MRETGLRLVSDLMGLRPGSIMTYLEPQPGRSAAPQGGCFQMQRPRVGLGGPAGPDRGNAVPSRIWENARGLFFTQQVADYCLPSRVGT